jgi:hypothetical protein
MVFKSKYQLAILLAFYWLRFSTALQLLPYRENSLRWSALVTSRSCKAMFDPIKNSSLLRSYQWTQRLESQQQIIHLELYNKLWPKWLLRILSRKFFKPAAKTGVRMYSTSSESMDNAIRALNITTSSLTINRISSNRIDNLSKLSAYKPLEGQYRIGLFVYMWITPKLRSQGIGDLLLSSAKDLCRKKGDDFILLVHEDNGSGKLISYYQQRGFVGIEDILNKSMICKL